MFESDEEELSPSEMAKKEKERRAQIARDKQELTQELAGFDKPMKTPPGTLGASTIKVEVSQNPQEQAQAEKNVFGDAARALAKDLTGKIFKTGNRTTNVLGQEIYKSKNPELIRDWDDFYNRMVGGAGQSPVPDKNLEAGTAVFFSDHFRDLVGLPTVKPYYSNYIASQKKDSFNVSDEEKRAVEEEEANAINALGDKRR